MSAAMTLLTPTKIAGWLECRYSLTLSRLMAEGAITIERSHPGELAAMLQAKGLAHEAMVLHGLVGQGKSLIEVPSRRADQSFDDWCASQLPLLETGVDVIAQMPFVHDGIRGIADFLIRVTREDGTWAYEPMEAKLTRSGAKPGHLLQLCFYAEAIEAFTGKRPLQLHIALGSGETEVWEHKHFDAYWRRIKHELKAMLHETPTIAPTSPERCTHCDICEFSPTCETRWRNEDSLIYVAGTSTIDRKNLKKNGVARLVELTTSSRPAEISARRFEQLQTQATLQLSRRENAELPVPFTRINPENESLWGHGYALLPKPAQGDVFFDLEGHPFFSPSDGLFFLFGCLVEENNAWVYRSWRADSKEDEVIATQRILSFFSERVQLYPDMHVYHYNHTERSALASLTEGTPAQHQFEELKRSGLFVDLLPILKNSFQIGLESYGLKSIEKVAGYERHAEIEAGSGAVIEYDGYIVDRDERHIQAIEAYNEDDVRATMAVRNWLIYNREEGLEWPEPPSLTDAESEHENAERERQLLGFPEGSMQHTMGLLINYWHRDYVALVEPLVAQASAEPEIALQDPSVIADLRFSGFQNRPHKTQAGKLVWEAVFNFPPQTLADNIGEHLSVMPMNGQERCATAPLNGVDIEEGEVRVAWRDPSVDEATPRWTAITPFDWMAPHSKLDALIAIADMLLDPTTASAVPKVTQSLLLNQPPRFRDGFKIDEAGFSSDLKQMLEWASHLDEGVVPIQGPPGTGKTFNGAHLAYHLVSQGRRVGVMSNSHEAISNFLRQTAQVFTREGKMGEFSARHHRDQSKVEPIDGVIATTSFAKKNLPENFQIVAGTAWFFSSERSVDAPVDVLIIDEASQVSLADAVAASLATKAIILLGDPQQLPHIQLASHPDIVAKSVLEYRLKGEATIPPSEGVFLNASRRMHPAVCDFISSQFYDSRLSAATGCELQQIAGAPSGLRWLEAVHTDRSIHAPEEVQIVVDEVRKLIGKTWTDYDHETSTTQVRPLGVQDIMVVAPFNQQRRAFQRAFSADPLLTGIRVGTVDKFQGQEAPVVFFSMTTSSRNDASRGLEFVLSLRRFNVAISRAKALSYVVCTSALLSSIATNVEEMRLVSLLNSFVENATTT